MDMPETNTDIFIFRKYGFFVKNLRAIRALSVEKYLPKKAAISAVLMVYEASLSHNL